MVHAFNYTVAVLELLRHLNFCLKCFWTSVNLVYSNYTKSGFQLSVGRPLVSCKPFKPIPVIMVRPSLSPAWTSSLSLTCLFSWPRGISCPKVAVGRASYQINCNEELNALGSIVGFSQYTANFIYVYIYCVSRGRHVSASFILGHLLVHWSLCSLQCQVWFT